MKNTFKKVFKSPKFVVGFIILAALLLTMLIYPLVVKTDPLEMVGQSSFMKPGTYVSVQDAVNSETSQLKIDASRAKLEQAFSMEDRMKMSQFLQEYCGVAEADINVADITAMLKLWTTNYDRDKKYDGLLNSEKKYFNSIGKRVTKILSDTSDMIIASKDDNGALVQDKVVHDNEYVHVGDIANQRTFLLGTDNFGRDVLTELVAAATSSLKIGLVAGLIATAIGLVLGLLAGYVGGVLDDLITFITNLFTVIPSFVLLILISYSISQSSRGIMVVAVIIGLTSWPWTCRSVRSQVISLRGRDHVNLMKLSGHGLPSIVIKGILPYIASYVVMALILQIAQGILAEAQLSMLGLGASTTTTATLGLMMTWATTFSAHVNGSWWAYFPVIIVIALISFSMNLMNTGLDQVFNPQLRD